MGQIGFSHLHPWYINFITELTSLPYSTCIWWSRFCLGAVSIVKSCLIAKCQSTLVNLPVHTSKAGLYAVGIKMNFLCWKKELWILAFTIWKWCRILGNCPTALLHVSCWCYNQFISNLHVSHCHYNWFVSTLPFKRNGDMSIVVVRH